MPKVGRGILVLVLTTGVLLGAYLGLARYRVEIGNRTVELCVDLNDLKKMVAFEKKPLAYILEEIKKSGITSVGVFEETLPDANARGELSYARGLNKPFRTYLEIPSDKVRKRVAEQLRWALGGKSVNFIGKEILEVDEAEEEIRGLGLGISESQHNFLTEKGFRIIPRVWNDPRYHLGNMEAKISGLKDYDRVIFDGEEILGYPDALPALAEALKKFKVKYGYIEIVKQDGDVKLRKLMGVEVVRVHSVPKDELKKIEKEEALDRFVRAARERGVRLIYLRPFLPPQVDAYPVEYNLKYFGELKVQLEKAGFVLGKVEKQPLREVKGWQVLLLGAGVVIGGLFLLDSFVSLPVWLMYVLLLTGAGSILFLGAAGYSLFLQKLLAFSSAVIFPSYAVIATFSKSRKGIVLLLWDSVLSVINILAETAVGILLMIGLLADYRFMTGVETFPAVKAALILPVLMVTGYFWLKSGEGSLRDRLLNYLNTKISLGMAFLGLFALVALAVLVARSGNFVLPVPGLEKYFRNWLEAILFVRPRTKEFLVGYPFLFLAAIYYLREKKTWLWLLAAAGTIAPVSVFNSFSHIHTPIMISMIRTFNGLVLGILVGMVVWLAVRKFVEPNNCWEAK